MILEVSFFYQGIGFYQFCQTISDLKFTSLLLLLQASYLHFCIVIWKADLSNFKISMLAYKLIHSKYPDRLYLGSYCRMEAILWRVRREELLNYRNQLLKSVPFLRQFKGAYTMDYRKTKRFSFVNLSYLALLIQSQRCKHGPNYPAIYFLAWSPCKLFPFRATFPGLAKFPRYKISPFLLPSFSFF